MKQRVGLIADRHDRLLQTYWNGATFVADPSKRSEPHVTTACTCLLSFVDVPAGGGVPAWLHRGAFAEWLVGVPWTSEDLDENNPYTAPLALEALARIDRLGDHIAKVKPAATALVTALDGDSPGRVSFSGAYPASGFLTYWAQRALRSTLDGAGTQVWRTARARAAVETLRRRALDWGLEEVYRQLAYHATGNLDRFDALQLGYALALADQRDAAQGRPPDTPLLKRGLEVFFDRQRPDGVWERNYPIFHYSGLGSVYPFAFETLTVVLQIGAREGEQGATQEFREELFVPHVDALMLAFDWAKAHERTDPLPGWRSNTVPPDGPASAWASAMVLSFCRGLLLLLERMGRSNVLREYRGRMPPASSTGTPLDASNWSAQGGLRDAAPRRTPACQPQDTGFRSPHQSSTAG